MTEHVHDDTILQLVLGVLDAESATAVRHHLNACPECRALLEEHQRTVRVLAGVQPDIDAPAPILPGRNRSAWLRVAALLVITFGAGYGVSESLRSPAIVTIRQQVIPAPPAMSDTGFVACQGLDLTRR